MAKARFTEKLERSLHLLMGLRHPEVREALAPFDLTDEVVAHGWALLTRAGMSRVESVPLVTLEGGTKKADPLAELNSFQSRWFPIARVTLMANYPLIAEAFFSRLAQERGSAIPFAVSGFLDRLATLERGDAIYGPDGPAARSLLERRGITKAVEGEAHSAIAASCELVQDVHCDDATLAAEETAAKALWSFYLEWSGIASRSLTNREYLRRLGLGRSKEKTEASKPLKISVRGQRALALPESSETKALLK